MRLDEIFSYFHSNAKIKNKHYFARYKKLIAYYLNSQINFEYAFEKHHILPKKMFPEFEKENWNIVKLPTKAHYIAHYLLFKSIKNKSCVYAFNQMRRIIKNTNPTCKLYASVRLEFSKLISEHNKQLKRTAEHNKSISDSNKNKNTYRSPTGELKRYIKGEQPDDWVPFQLGRKKLNKSKKLISEKNSNRKWQYNELTKEVCFEKCIKEGYTQGFPPWFTRAGLKTSNTVWIHNAVTKQNKRLHINSPIPEGFEFGRQFINKGFDKANDKNYKKVLDLLEKKICLMPVENLNLKRYVSVGNSIDNVYLYKYNDMVYTTKKDLFEHNEHLPKCTGEKDLLMKKIPKPHFNNSIARKKFCTENQGKTFKDIGVITIPIQEYIFNETEIYVRCK